MEKASKRLTRKPKKTQSGLFAGPFTRSKFQIYSHCNRSGRARTDPFRHQSLVNKRPSGTRRFRAASTSPPEIDIANEEEEAWSGPSSIKDLRSRRVFSPTSSSISGECGLFVVDAEVAKCPDLKQSADSEEAIAMDVEERGFVALEKEDCQLIESQQTLIDGSKRDDYPAESHAGGFGVPLDGEILSSGVSDGNGSNLMSAKQDSDALQLFGSQNYACMNACAPTSLVDVCCSKSLVNEGNEKIEIRVSCNDENLNDSSLDQDSLMVNTCFSCYSTGKELACSEYTQRIDAQHVSETRHGSSLTMEKPGTEDDDEEFRQCSGDLLQTGACRATAFVIYHPRERINADPLSPDFADVKERGRLCDKKQKANDSSDVSDEIVDSNRESLHMTETDRNILGKTEGYGDVSNAMKCPLHRANQVLEKTSCGSARRDNFSNRVKSVRCSPKRKLGLNPCSRLTLFKIPSSFSYKRLLPYLRDLNEDDSGGSKSRLCPGLEKYPKQKPLSTLLTSDSQVIPVKKLNGKSESDTPEMKLLTASNHVADGDRPNIESSEHRGETSVSLVAHGQVEVFDEVRQPEAAPKIVNLLNERGSKTLPLSPLVGHKWDGGEIPNCVLHKLSDDERENSIVKSTPNASPTEGGNFSENSFQLEASYFQQISAHGPQKSILKRHPRGCRGICTCLNCASFRLHAERAFEFSQNQMQDAEEVASDLIKELSHLRVILEKAAFGPNQDSVFCISQAKEACRNASEVEELAKTRLEQMNCDLSIHCRIECGQRPRVRFAKNVEAKVIP